MSVTSDLLRGNTDTIILSLLQEKDSYGYEINKEIGRRSKDLYELNEATLYTAFKRLEKSGAIKSYWGDQDSGARRKYYSITLVGKAMYKMLLEEWNSAKRIIDDILEIES